MMVRVMRSVAPPKRQGKSAKPPLQATFPAMADVRIYRRRTRLAWKRPAGRVHTMNLGSRGIVPVPADPS
jgi:hypothetical protein